MPWGRGGGDVGESTLRKHEMAMNVICDLDGVLYRGDTAIPGAEDALQRLFDGGLNVVFATNNSTRTPARVAEKIEALLGMVVDPSSIVTSALSAVSVLGPDSQRCLVVGGRGLREAVEDSGRVCVAENADAVLVGLDPSFTYQALARAAEEIRNGAVFVASNSDATYPVSDGVRPGAGSIVSAIAVASGVTPLVTGKPELPIRELIRALGVGHAWVVGDRIDTDIRMASKESDWSSILVMSGVTGTVEDLSEADHVVPDLVSAVDLVLGALDES